MAGKYTLEQFEANRQARQEREAREAEERKERVAKEAARRAWLRDGGSERDFERQWPEMRVEARRRRIADADSRARAAQRGSGVSRI